MSTLQPVCRVTVLGLGHGRYIADVNLYVILLKDRMICSETKPTKKEVHNLRGKLLEFNDNPKIILDNGQVVYGCEVFWEPTPQEN